jgi:hypothetical protein
VGVFKLYVINNLKYKYFVYKINMRKRSAGSILISNLDAELKEMILNLDVKKETLKRFDEEEDKERVAQLVDLRDIYTKTETELYKTLNLMVANKQ